MARGKSVGGVFFDVRWTEQDSCQNTCLGAEILDLPILLFRDSSQFVLLL